MNRKNFLKAVGLSCMLSFTVATAIASEAGTAPEAEALVKKAVDYFKANGPDKAFEEFSGGKSFKDRDLYIIVYDMKGVCLAHGANRKLVGKDLIALKDADGKPLVKMFLDVAEKKGKGWVEPVKFRNPTNDKIQTRLNYVERVGDVVVGSGIFKD